MARPKGTSNITEDQIKTIYMMNEMGTGASRISDVTGLSRPTIYSYIKKLDTQK